MDNPYVALRKYDNAIWHVNYMMSGAGRYLDCDIHWRILRGYLRVTMNSVTVLTYWSAR